MIVRVATNNNFNCTDPEWTQLRHFEDQHPDKTFFVNSNIRTPGLPSINDHQNKAVITVNPDLTVYSALVARLDQLNPARIAFLRVKYLPESRSINTLIQVLTKAGYPVVMTLQRFNSRATLEKWADEKHYKLECSRFRLAGGSLDRALSLADQSGAFVCDRKGLGCLGCGLCAALNGQEGAEIRSLNLSTSGSCPYSCPDCYAKANQVRCAGRICLDKIYRNQKQAGETVHIKHARKETGHEIPDTVAAPARRM